MESSHSDQVTRPTESIFNRLVFALTHSNPFARAGAATALGKLNIAAAVGHLEGMLEDPESFVVECAARGLARIAPAGVAALLAEIQSPVSEKSRRHASAALGEVRDPGAVDMLGAALAYAEAAVRWGAARALGEIRDPRALEPLSKAALHEDPITRQYAAESIGAIGEEGGITPLASLLGDDDPEIRMTAVKGFGRIGGAAVLEPLFISIEDKDKRVREIAAESLRKIRDPLAIDTLLIALGDPKKTVRMSAVEALSYMADSSLIPRIHEVAYEDDELLVRLRAAAGLARLGDDRGRMILRRTLNAPNARTRLSAALELGQIGDMDAVEHLLNPANFKPEMSADDRIQLQAQIVAALSSIGEPVIDPMLEGLRSSEVIVRRISEETLERIGAPVIPALIGLLETIPGTARYVVPLLGRIGGPESADTLIRRLGSTGGVLGWARSAIRVIFDPRVRERRLVITALENLAHRGIAGEKISRALENTAVHDPDGPLRDDAMRVIARLGKPLDVLRMASTGSTPILLRGVVSVLYFLIVGLSFVWAFAAADVRFWLFILGVLLGVIWGLVDGFESRPPAVRGAFVGLLLSLVLNAIVKAVTGAIHPLMPTLSFSLISIGLGIAWEQKPVRNFVFTSAIGLGLGLAVMTIGLLVFV